MTVVTAFCSLPKAGTNLFKLVRQVGTEHWNKEKLRSICGSYLCFGMSAYKQAAPSMVLWWVTAPGADGDQLY